MGETDRTIAADRVGGSLFDDLEPGLRERLLAGSEAWTADAGETIIPPALAWTRAALITSGLARAYLAAGDGRQLTVRYARPGEMIGNVVPVAVERAPLGIAAVTRCHVLELDVDGLRRSVASDPMVAAFVLETLSRRLENTYATLAANTFGTMRERIAGHLLDLAESDPVSGILAANVTQQQLADSVGSVREVVARTLREFRDEGLVSTAHGSIVLVDTSRLAALVGRWRSRA